MTINRFIFAALFLVACKSSDPLFCDAEHPCTDPAKPYCDLDGTYPASDGVAKTCIADPGGGGDCDGDEDCTDPAFPACEAETCHECRDATQCTASAPVCDAGFSCAACTAPADCAAYTDTPVCGASGACVECDDNAECSGTTPVCNAAGSCEACTAHDQCDSGICDASTGACVAEGMIAYVSTTGSGTACSKATPCDTVQKGVDAARPYVLVSAGTYDGSLAIDGTQLVTIVGPATIRPAGIGEVVLTITGTARVVLQEISVTGTSGGANAIECGGVGGTAGLSVLNGSVTGNSGMGIDATDCDLVVDRSTIAQNGGGGIKASTSRFVVRNTFIVSNGLASTFGGIRIDGPAPAGSVLEFTTMVGNSSSGLAGQTRGVRCADVASPLTFRGVIIWGDGVQVPAAESNCLFDQSNLVSGASGTNISTEPTYVNAEAGNYHLAPGSAGIDMGGTVGVPAVDFDGEARPQGAAADIGADEVVP